jgi:thioredoxin reductase (NADPH)
VLRLFQGTETLIVVFRAEQFTGEANMISGRRAMARLRVSEPGEVIELTRDQLLALVQTDAELGEILMRGFILRRLELIALDLGDVVVIGSDYGAGTQRVKEFLTRNGHPFHYVDVDLDRDGEARSCSIAFMSPSPIFPYSSAAASSCSGIRRTRRSPIVSASTRASITRA